MSNTHRNLYLLLIISATVRALIAGFFELGNDEVYYWTYAVYPDLSYFDHPPLVGWLIRFFTANLHLQQEFFIRLASVVGGTINTWLIFRIGKKLSDELTGWYAALLFTASIYGFIISGTFILPDTPQTVFWLSALLLMLQILPDQTSFPENKWKIAGIGLFLGLGMLSKYTTAFLWSGMVLFILIYNRSWLRQWKFYLANLIIAALFSVVIVWNAINQFVSFSFQGSRAGLSGFSFSLDSFLMEVGGEILYNNPFVFVLIIVSLIEGFRDKSWRSDPKVRILLLSGLPLIGTFLALSLFRNTLPHWSGPGYLSLIPLTALWIRRKNLNSTRAFPKSLLYSLLILMLIIGLSIAQTLLGFVRFDPESITAGKKGAKDLSLEVYGWRQMGARFNEIAERYELSGQMPISAPIVTYRWFPAANLEYYAARSSGRHVLVNGSLEEAHNYKRVNKIHGGFRLNSDAWYITSSRDFRAPELLKPLYYARIMPPDTIRISRNGQTAYFFFVYRMKNLQSKLEE